jgi:hypothetical protein
MAILHHFCKIFPRIKSNENFRQTKLSSSSKELSSLKTISSELVRQNWDLNPDIFANETQIYHKHFYKSFWNSWYSKMGIVRSNTQKKLVKDFITYNDKKEIIDTIENTDKNLHRKIINNKLTLTKRFKQLFEIRISKALR